MEVFSIIDPMHPTIKKPRVFLYILGGFTTRGGFGNFEQLLRWMNRPICNLARDLSETSGRC